jgi:CelD/BcsL family acetyltransferase involved in cellulose biosynthesis
VCAPEDRAAVVRALKRALAERRWGWQVLFASELPVEEGCGEMLGGRVWGSQPSPVLDLTGLDWDGYLATRSTNARQQIRRRERRLRENHDVSIRTTTEPARVQDDLEIFDRLHRARWGEASQVFAGDWGRFARDFAQRAAERGWLNLRFLDVDGQPAACYFGFRYAGVENYWQAGRDPRFDELSVGAVLLADTIRDAIDSGAREFRFLRGDEAYKLRYASHDPGLEARVLSRGAVGTISVRGAATARSLLSYERRQRLARLLR